MVTQRLRDLSEQLQGKKPHLPHFLSEVRLNGIRGIDDLRVVFDYPVSVIAGGNATGKSTVLFAAACAYKVPNAGPRDFVPSTLFPSYYPKTAGRKDERREVIIEFDYSTPGGRQSMRWRRTSKGWNRSFLGRKGASQPERPVYIRTLSNLSNPSEVRGVLSMSNLGHPPEEERLTASQIEFAHQMLPFRYDEVVELSGGSKNLLFASQQSGVAYSEFHMAAGERAILRLSQQIAQLNGALVLVDEVEAGLHPSVQQLLMLQLQQLALRNNLQIIVTSHSPIVLDSVPANGRIFLDRDETGKVTVRPAYHDIVQDALYGRLNDTLNLLCEDDAAEGILLGVFDHLLPKLGVKPDSVRIGRDTGAEEFPAHALAFRKFGQIQGFIFVLDGDKRGTNIPDRIHEGARREVPILYLPGSNSPEEWVWRRLSSNQSVATELGIGPSEFASNISQLNQLFDSASDSSSQIAKTKLYNLADRLHRTSPEVCRILARLEADLQESDIQPLAEGLENSLLNWRGQDW